MGGYPVPPGASKIIGLECVGHVVKDGKPEEPPVMALLSGGGYGQYATVNASHVMPIPSVLQQNLI